MEMLVLNKNFETIYILDSCESFLWVDKFYTCGTFELYTPVTKDVLKYLAPNNYIVNRDSDHTMIIEDISIESDSESGDHIKIIGRSLESILDRRIVWNQVKYSNRALHLVVADLLTKAITNPSIKDRKIDNFIFDANSWDEKIKAIKVDKQYTGDNLLDVIETLCDENKIGYKIILNDQNQFVFYLYLGVDRSYYQSINSYVVFSPEFDNVINSNYTDKNSQLKNVALVAGEGEGSSRKTKIVGAYKGLDRRELYTDARDIQKDDLSSSKYMALLEKRGSEKLKEANKKREFDGKCDTSHMYEYGKDFFLGDTVQVANEYGIESPSIITEFTWSYGTSGYETYPTFSAIEDKVFTGKNKLTTTLDYLRTANDTGEWTGNVYYENGLTLTVNQDAKGRVIGLTVEGTNESDSQFIFSTGIIDSTVNNLILSGTTGGSSTTYNLVKYDVQSGTYSPSNYNGDTSLSIDLSHEQRICIRINTRIDLQDGITFYPMVRETTRDNLFEPYDENSI